MRQLDEHACTVTGEGIGPYSSTVGQIGEDGLALLDDPMALPTPRIRDKADPAGIVIQSGIVEPSVVARVLSFHGARQPNEPDAASPGSRLDAVRSKQGQSL
jgi:hypothetical protein